MLNARRIAEMHERVTITREGVGIVVTYHLGKSRLSRHYSPTYTHSTLGKKRMVESIHPRPPLQVAAWELAHECVDRYMLADKEILTRGRDRLVRKFKDGAYHSSLLKIGDEPGDVLIETWLL